MHNSTSQTYTGIFNDSFPPILDGVTLTVMNYVRWLPQSGMRPCVVTPWNPRRAECGCDVMRYFSLPIPSRRPYRYGYPKADPFIFTLILHPDNETKATKTVRSRARVHLHTIILYFSV